MEIKKFSVSSLNMAKKKVPPFKEEGIQHLSDEELVAWLMDPKKDLSFKSIDDLTIHEEASGKRTLRLDLMMRLIKPRTFIEGEELTPIFFLPLPGKKVPPPLKPHEKYTLKRIFLDLKGNQYLDVGLPSKYLPLYSYETRELLPDSDTVYWCHAIRFK